MTDSLMDSGSSEGVAVSGSSSSPAQQSYNPAPAQSTSSPASAENGQYFTQSQIDEMLKAKIAQARTKGEEEARRRYEGQSNANQNTQSQSNQPGKDYLTADQARKIAQEEYQAQVNQQQTYAQQQQMEGLVKNVADKIKGVQSQYPDILEKLSVVNNFDNAPNSLIMLSGLDNAGEVAYELASNPRKLIELEEMASKYPLAAQQQLAQLATSIKQNQNAGQGKKAPSPLNQIQPSNVSVDDGDYTSNDLRSFLRSRKGR